MNTDLGYSKFHVPSGTFYSLFIVMKSGRLYIKTFLNTGVETSGRWFGKAGKISAIALEATYQ